MSTIDKYVYPNAPPAHIPFSPEGDLLTCAGNASSGQCHLVKKKGTIEFERYFYSSL